MVAQAVLQEGRRPLSGPADKLTVRERLRWSGSVVIALGLHAVVVAALIATASPGQPPVPDVTDIELTLIDPPPPVQEAPPAPTPDKPLEPRPVPPADNAAPPVPAVAPSPPQIEAASPAPQTPPPLPFHEGGFAIAPGPAPTAPPSDLATTVPSTPDSLPLWPQRPPAPPQTATAAPAARLSPLVITSGARHDPRLPSYPTDARTRGEQGDVLVEIALDPGGALRSARVKQSSGHTSLDAAALQSARGLRFRPPRPPPGIVLRHDILVEVPFSFRLE